MNVDWQSIVSQWIQSKEQMPEAPEPPRITGDNHTEADMEIEEEVKDNSLEQFQQTWSTQQAWQNSQALHQPPWYQNQQQQQQALPIIHQNFQKFVRPPALNLNTYNITPQPHHHHQQQQFKSLENVQPEAPEPPPFNQPVDMVLDDSDGGEDSSTLNIPVLDEKKRKMLPNWIREGLEKMEREKKLEEERIQQEKQLQDEEEKRKKMMTEALMELEREKLVKSKFESESENDDNDEEQRDETPEPPDVIPQKETTVYHRMNDEDSYEKMMLLVRKNLTEILLEVTNELVEEISNETLSKYRKKASSVTTVRARSIVGGLGLGIYSGSSDEDESDGADNEDVHSDFESESALKERIRQKEFAFEQKAKDIHEKLAKLAELEEERFRPKTEFDARKPSRYDSDSSNDAHKFKRRKNDGEEMIYSISGSSASGARREKKTRFSDPKDGRSSNVLLTHVSMVESVKSHFDSTPSSIIIPTPEPSTIEPQVPSGHLRKKRDSSSSSSSGSSRRKKHKKHKKSSKSKHNKRSRSSDHKKRHEKSDKIDKDKHHRHSHKSDRYSIESKSSARSNRSNDSKRHRSRSRDRRRY